MPVFSSNGNTVCTEPLPKLVVPRITARLLSLSAPATISAADAEPLLINTTIGALCKTSTPLDMAVKSEPGRRPLVETIVSGLPDSSLPRNASET
ncbi:hypothetical protein lpari_03641 [Legionella parisiensis]|uniref:Uncharacterized protein n=1 Tax=Legionella parisiensis TaxID=45071 RepID=A0A1E5JLH4_9GAMM|nr:hypothetical protein lpari_03641 [Legionella parisiensis]